MGSLDVARLRQHMKRVGVRRGLPEPAERRRIREAAGLSQSHIAEVLLTTQVTVSRWETGEREPSDAYVADYADLLSYLVSSTEDALA